MIHQKDVVIRGVMSWQDDIQPPPIDIIISPDLLPEMKVGVLFSCQICANGGFSPHTFSASSNLPEGLSLSPQGLLEGIPVTSGFYSLSVHVVDSRDNSADRTYTGTIAEADVVPPASTTITKDNFEYLGSYRVDQQDAALFTYAYGGITGRKVNGKTRIFITGNEVNYHAPLLEFEIPSEPPNKDYMVAPQLRRVRFWGDIYGGRRGTYMQTADAQRSARALDKVLKEERNPIIRAEYQARIDSLKAWAKKHKSSKSYQWYEFPVGQSAIGSLYWEEATKRVFWTYYDTYNVSGRPDWALGASVLNDDVPESDPASFTAYGPWRIACPNPDGWIAYGAWRGLGLVIRPDTGELLTNGSMMSGNASSPWGNNCYGGRGLPANNHPWNIDLMMPTRYLEHYYMGGGGIDQEGRLGEGVELRSQIRRKWMPKWENFGGGLVLNINNEIYGYDSWRQVDGSGILMWINDLNGKSGVVFLGNIGVDHEWYATTANNHACPNHQVPEPVTVTGPVSTRSVAAMWIYKLEDILSVSRNEIPDYSPEPEEINLTDEFGVHGSWPSVMSGNNAIGGTYFDKEESLLYLMSPRCDDVSARPELAPLFHVFRLS